PDTLSFEQGVLAQLLGCNIWALKKIGPVFDKNVAIVGQGPAGLFFTKLLSNMGAKRVIGLDLDEHRLSTAHQMGATHTINATDNNEYRAQVRDITKGQMADLVIESVGLPETVDMTINLGREYADLLIFGIPKVTPTPIDIYKSLRMQQRWITTVGTQFEPNLSSFRLGMQMIKDGRVDVTPLISHSMPFGDLAQALKMAKTREDKTIKIMMEMQRFSSNET
ncbi:MAG: zinc-dependent alcohol dehydrogenase, partial [Candidatus Promineifilaceae bacterium]